MEKQRLNIGSTIKKYRKAKKYSTKELAELVGISEGGISNLELDKNYSIKLDLFLKIIEVLDIPLEEVLIPKRLKADFSNVDNKSVEITLKYSEVENAKEVTEELTKVVNSFVELLALYKFDKGAAEVISSRIVKETEYIKKLKDLRIG